MSDSGLMSDSCLIHCQFEDFYIVLLEKKNPAVDWTVRKIGSVCKGNFPASFILV